MNLFNWLAPAQEAGLPWWPLVLVIGVLLLINVVNNRVAPNSHYLLWSFASSVILLALGLLDGNTFTDMGLSWTHYLSGLIWAGICIGAVTLVYVVGIIFKPTRNAFRDERHAELRLRSAPCCSRCWHVVTAWSGASSFLPSSSAYGMCCRQ